MPSSFPMDLANFPSLRTKKALLVLDLQNEFLSPAGSLPVTTPSGFVDRILDVVHAFRQARVGEVFWIRSQFETPRLAASAQIISSREQAYAVTAVGRRRLPQSTEENQDVDPEAFLSIPEPGRDSPDSPDDADELRQQRVHSLGPKGSGSELYGPVAAAVAPDQDVVLTKSHYSAFESSQLLMRLRTRFATELFICGALTNISVYATALDAASHGLALTIIDDCCGYRNESRHNTALSNLVQLTGCETVSADAVMRSLAPQQHLHFPAASLARLTTGSSSGGGGGGGSGSGSDGIDGNDTDGIGKSTTLNGSLPVRNKSSESGHKAASPRESSQHKKDTASSKEVKEQKTTAKPPPREPQPKSSSKLPSVVTPPNDSTSSPNTLCEVHSSSTSDTLGPGCQSPERSSRSSSRGSRGSRGRSGRLNDAEAQPQHNQPELTTTASAPSSGATNTGAVAVPPADSHPTSAPTIQAASPQLSSDGLIEVDPDEVSYDECDESLSTFLLRRTQRQIARSPSSRQPLTARKGLLHDHNPTTTTDNHRRADSRSASSGRSGGNDRKRGSVNTASPSHQRRSTQTHEPTEGQTPATSDSRTLPEDESSTPKAGVSTEAASESISSRASVSKARPTPEPDSKPAMSTRKATTAEPESTASAELEAQVKAESPIAAGANDGGGAAGGADPTSEAKEPPATASAAKQQQKHTPTASTPLCEGDTIVYHDVLPPSLEEGVYERLRDEVHWLRMSHQGGEVPRLVCVQGDIDTDAQSDTHGDMPVYRHPADESPPLEPFSPTVVAIKAAVEATVGHPLNHVLIQLYRSGNDYISEHSDKTLDIVPGSYVCNVSLGAERTMVFRTKRPDRASAAASPTPGKGGKGGKGDKSSDDTADAVADGGVDGARNKAGDDAGDDAVDTAVDATVDAALSPRKSARPTVRVQLPHNSLCRMGLQTNLRWLHSIRQDKRAGREKAAAELAFGGERISLTFRRIGTFLNGDQTRIWGQGAVAKTRQDARPVVNGQADEVVRMLRAFGRENQSSHFDWAQHYGAGFDVLHMHSWPRFFSSTDVMVNMTVQLMLAELGIDHAKGKVDTGNGPLAVSADAPAAATSEAPAALVPSSLDVPVRFVDTDAGRSTVHGVLAILLYLDAVYAKAGTAKAETAKAEQIAESAAAEKTAVAARTFSRLQQAIRLQDALRASRKGASSCTLALKPLDPQLMVWSGYAAAAKRDGSGQQGGKESGFIAGGAEPSVADFALFPVLHEIEHICGSEYIMEAKLGSRGMDDLAQYYLWMKARDNVQRVLKVLEVKNS